MSKCRQTEEMKRIDVIVQLAEEHSVLDTAVFFKLARTFVFKVRNKLKDSKFGCAKHFTQKTRLFEI